MLCDNCKENPAAVHLTKIVQGEIRTAHLCERCAAEQGVETQASTNKQNPLGMFLQEVHSQAGQQGDAVRCSFCSMTLRDFRTSGRLGCALCYGSFERNLRELLRRVHGSSRHVGRQYEVPESLDNEQTGTLLELRDRLQRAIDTEQFELAANLRDQIRGME